MDMSIQDFPGRSIGLGIPRSGPMDELAFRVGNILVGNHQGTEGIEMVLLPGMPPVRIKFFCSAVVAITGANVEVVTNSELRSSWSRIAISQDTTLSIKALKPESDKNAVGFRVYVCVHGGLPGIPVYLGSKSTSVGLGGYQVCDLLFMVNVCSLFHREGRSYPEINWLFGTLLSQHTSEDAMVITLFSKKYLSVVVFPNAHTPGSFMFFQVLATTWST